MENEYNRYDKADVPAQVTELNMLYIEGVVLHSVQHQCLPSTGGVGKVAVTKVCAPIGRCFCYVWWSCRALVGHCVCVVNECSFIVLILRWALRRERALVAHIQHWVVMPGQLTDAAVQLTGIIP